MLRRVAKPGPCGDAGGFARLDSTTPAVVDVKLGSAPTEHFLPYFPKSCTLTCIYHYLTAGARRKTATTSLCFLAVLNVLSSTPARKMRLVPRPVGPLTHFASPHSEKCSPGLAITVPEIVSRLGTLLLDCLRGLVR